MSDMTTKGTAFTLGISPHTVREHVLHVYATLDVASRVGAVLAYARRSGETEGG